MLFVVLWSVQKISKNQSLKIFLFSYQVSGSERQSRREKFQKIRLFRNSCGPDQPLAHGSLRLAYGDEQRGREGDMLGELGGELQTLFRDHNTGPTVPPPSHCQVRYGIST